MPLDDTKFAHMLPDIHADLPLHAVMLCSPLTRCLHLANALQVLACSRSIVITPSLIEHDFGAWEGRHWDDIPRDEIDAWAADYLHYAPPNGESVALMAARCEALMRNHQRHELPLIILSHAGPLAAISAQRQGAVLSANTPSQAQGSVVELVSG